jgi:hypothetical protein
MSIDDAYLIQNCSDGYCGNSPMSLSNVQIPSEARPTNDAVAILLSELQAATALTPERRAGHWIPMHWTQLRASLGSRYKAAIRAAVDEGFVEANDHYAVDRFSKSYRLAKKYRVPTTQLYELRRSLPTQSRIRIKDSDTVGQRLVEQFARVRLTETLSDWDGYCAAQIRRGCYYATRCQYGRFHSTFTGLKRSARSKLTVCGERLVELDIANCQPLILGLLARINKQPISSHQAATTATTRPHTICRAFLADYIALCESGKLYEHLEGLCRGKLTLRDCIPVDRWHRHASDRPLTRKDVKRQYLVMLFADVATTKSMPLFDVVANEWQDLADYILAAKSNCYQDLARDCQRLESRLMIDGAAGALLDESAIVIITIHDSIMTTLQYRAAVEASVIHQFDGMGVTPYIRLSEC